MTTHERIEQQSFRYEPSLPPSVPEGQPLREVRVARTRRERGVLAWFGRRRRTTR